MKKKEMYDNNNSVIQDGDRMVKKKTNTCSKKKCKQPTMKYGNFCYFHNPLRKCNYKRKTTCENQVACSSIYCRKHGGKRIIKDITMVRTNYTCPMTTIVTCNKIAIQHVAKFKSIGKQILNKRIEKQRHRKKKKARENEILQHYENCDTQYEFPGFCMDHGGKFFIVDENGNKEQFL